MHRLLQKMCNALEKSIKYNLIAYSAAQFRQLSIPREIAHPCRRR